MKVLVELHYQLEIEGETKDLKDKIQDCLCISDELLKERIVEGDNWTAKVCLVEEKVKLEE